MGEESKVADVQERFDTFLQRVSTASEGLGIAGVTLSVMILSPGEEEGKSTVTVFGNAYLPPMNDPLVLYRLRDDMARQATLSVNGAVEIALKAALTPADESKAEG